MILLKNLFTPIHIGGMEVKNRISMAPMAVRLARDGYVTPSLVQYFTARARGGAGLIFTGDTTISASARFSVNGLRLDDDRYITGWRELTQAIHSYGAKIGPQLVHPSFNSNPAITGIQSVGASPISSRRTKQIPKELTVAEIEEIIEQFGEAAHRAVTAGCDSISIHCAHMYHLLGSFITPLYNKRTDSYGGSLAGRLKLILEVIQKIRAKVGPDFPIFIRISGDEYQPGGRTIEESQFIAPLLVEAGVNAIHVSAGTNETPEICFPPTGSPLALNASLSAAIKKVVNVPVICVGRITNPWIAENILATCKADMVALGRALLADPEFPNKALRGEWDDIVPCIGDTMCLVSVRKEKQICCLMNPTAGREAEMKLVPASIGKKVLVVGGGPAGMEAAQVAALRGHQVTLMEKASKLGGQMLIACVPPIKQEYTLAVQYLNRQLDYSGVRVELNQEVTPEVIRNVQPDLVIIATGGIPLIPQKILGIEKNFAVTAWDVLAGKVVVGPKVLIIGGGKVGCETADFIAHPVDDMSPKGNRVTIIEMLENIAMDEHGPKRSLLIQRLRNKGVTIILGAKVSEILRDGIKYFKEGKEETLRGIDSVVLAVGTKSYNPFNEEIKRGSIPFYIIGDAKEPRTALEAIAEGAQIGWEI